jgi:hypothetical protein
LTDAIKNKGIDKVDLPLYGVFNSSMVKKLLKDAINYHEKYIDGGVQPCPLHKNYFKIFNFSTYAKNDFEKILPNGDYRYEHKYWNDQDENIFTKTVYERFKTMEDSFI